MENPQEKSFNLSESCRSPSAKSRGCQTPTRSPMREVIFTSTPFMQSEIGQRIIRKHFIKNIPQDISTLEADVAKINININDKPQEKIKTPEARLFVFKKEATESTKYEFNPPAAVSPETMRKFHELFGYTPKVKRRRMRL